MKLSDFIEGCERSSNFTNKVDIHNLICDLKKINESQKETVPKFIGDWIFKAQLVDGLSIRSALDTATIRLYAKNSDEVIAWLKGISNQDTFARAWLDGYQTEKKKHYLVRMKGVGSESFLNHNLQNDTWLVYTKDNCKTIKTHHTRKELEEAGFGEVFNSPLFEVEEVTK